MTVALETVGSTLVVTIHRPDVRNAVDRPTADLLEQAFRGFAVDDRWSVAVLTGADGDFCSGADLTALDKHPDRVNRLERSDRAPMGPTRLHVGKPVIAAIEGHAVAGGLELACWADLRVMASDAVLGVYCRRWGVPLIDGGTVRLPRLVGLSIATDLILTGRPVDAEEAARIGLANRVVGPGEALPSALELADQLAAFPQACLRADLLSTRAGFDVTTREALLSEHDRGVASMASGEMSNGLRRFSDGAGRGGSFR